MTSTLIPEEQHQPLHVGSNAPTAEEVATEEDMMLAFRSSTQVQQQAEALLAVRDEAWKQRGEILSVLAKMGERAWTKYAGGKGKPAVYRLWGDGTRTANMIAGCQVSEGVLVKDLSGLSECGKFYSATVRLTVTNPLTGLPVEGEGTAANVKLFATRNIKNPEDRAAIRQAAHTRALSKATGGAFAFLHVTKEDLDEAAGQEVNIGGGVTFREGKQTRDAAREKAAAMTPADRRFAITEILTSRAVATEEIDPIVRALTGSLDTETGELVPGANRFSDIPGELLVDLLSKVEFVAKRAGADGLDGGIALCEIAADLRLTQLKQNAAKKAAEGGESSG